MSKLDSSFEQLLGRQPTDKERQDLYKVRDALQLQNNDALWLVLMALQHYQTQYEKIPQAIEKTASQTLQNVKEAAKQSIQATAEQTKHELAQAVSKAAQQVAKDTAGTQKLKWLAGCAVILAAILGVGYYFVSEKAYTAGFNSGYGRGYNESKDEKAAAAWANTPQGKMAYKFAQSSDISKIATCDKPGWYVKNGVCFVKTAPDGNVYGWKLP